MVQYSVDVEFLTFLIQHWQATLALLVLLYLALGSKRRARFTWRHTKRFGKWLWTQAQDWNERRHYKREHGTKMPKKRRRDFTKEERIYLFDAAGWQCEWQYEMPDGWQRCQAMRRPGVLFHADHVWPFAHEGETDVTNGACLCAEHNIKKSDHLPSRKYLERLTEARREYYRAPIPDLVGRH